MNANHGSSPVSQSRFLSWRAAGLFAIVLGVISLLIVHHLGDTPPTWYPPCPLYATTGILCPGCGSARTLHDLVHGNLRAACGHNILLVLAAPFLLAWGLCSLWRALLRNAPPPRPPTRLARPALVIVLLFMLARNLPFHPFHHLAP